MNRSIWGVPVYHQPSGFSIKDFNEEENQTFAEILKKDYSTYEDIPNEVRVLEDKGKLLERKELIRIRKLVDKAAQYYRKEVICMEADIRLSASWLTINRKGDAHPTHKHWHSLFSLCYYPQVESGNLVLYAENRKNIFQRDFNWGMSYTKWNEFNCADWTIPVKSGDIVIFPSWVEHKSTPNESNIDRWMIGVNYWLTGELVLRGDLDRIIV